MDQLDIINEIKKLKLKKDAIILAHNYQDSSIQDIADVVGDSLNLSKVAKDTKHKTIVFCGVTFMAETAKILSPEKTVLLPSKDAICPMARMVTPEEIIEYKKKNHNTTVVCYVNSTTEVKAVSDVCLTSANALRIIKNITNKDILLVPDENLGQYIKDRVQDKNITLWPGYCITHKRVQKEEVLKVKELIPDGKILVHPECTNDILKEADFIGSTSQIISYVSHSNYSKFIIGTEMGVLYKLKKEHPNKIFYLLSPGLVCINMKKTKLIDVYNALKFNQHKIQLKEDIRLKAYKCINKMFELDIQSGR